MSPIHGVTDVESLVPMYPFLGWLRKGAPKTSDTQPGQDLEYFRYVPRPGPGSEELAAAFLECYGEKPDSINAYLPFDLMAECFVTWREAWQKGRILKLRCDGRNWVYWLTGWEIHTGSQPCTLDYYDPDRRCPTCPCKPVGRLSVILEPMWKMGHVGLVTVVTGGINDMVTIGGVLLANQPLTGKEFRIYRQPQQVGAPIMKDNRRISVEKYLVKVELTKDWVLRQLDAQRAEAAALLTARAGGQVIDGTAYQSAGQVVPEPEAPTADFDDEPPPWFEGEYEAGSVEEPPAQGPEPGPQEGGDSFKGKRLDRNATPQDWTEFYTWAARGGYSQRDAFATIKAAYPDASRNNMPSVGEAVGALLADQDFQLSQGEDDAAEAE